MQRQYRQDNKPTPTFDNNSTSQVQTTVNVNNTFAGILRKGVASYQQSGRYADFQSLNSGTTQIQTLAQATAYLAAYGDMHRLKLNRSFDALFSKVSLTNQVIDVIDWGCGQGLASGVLLDYMRQHQTPLKPVGFTLIEPSALAISRAVEHLQLLTDAPIRPWQRTAEAIPASLLVTDPQNVKLHLFSNLLDMPSVDYAAIARIIRSSQVGMNWFVCVSPAIADFRNKRLREFRDQFSGATTLSNRTDCFMGTVFRMTQNGYGSYLIRHTECLFSVQL